MFSATDRNVYEGIKRRYHGNEIISSLEAMVEAINKLMPEFLEHDKTGHFPKGYVAGVVQQELRLAGNAIQFLELNSVYVLTAFEASTLRCYPRPKTFDEWVACYTETLATLKTSDISANPLDFSKLN